MARISSGGRASARSMAGFELDRIADVDQLRPGSLVPERHHRLVGEQELAQRGRRVGCHHVRLREQVEDVVGICEVQVLALERAVLGDRCRVRLRMQAHDPAPAPGARQPLPRSRRASRQRSRTARRSSGTGRRAVAATGGGSRYRSPAGRVELRPAGLAHREVAEAAMPMPGTPACRPAGRAVQVEETPVVNVPRLAGIKPWKTCTFTPGKKCGRRMLGDRTAQAFQRITSSTARSSVSSGPSSCQPSPSKNHAASSPAPGSPPATA